MEIEIRNFGPIDSIKFDLTKDMHLIYGKNATGKSYATYCLYCIIKSIKNKSIQFNSYRYDSFESNPFYKVAKSALKNAKFSKINLDLKEYITLIEEELKKLLLQSLQNSLQNTFTSLRNLKNRYSNKNYEIIIKLSSNENLIFFSNNKGELDLKYEQNFKNIEIVLKKTKSTKYSLYIDNKIAYGKPVEEQFLYEFAKLSINNINDILTKLNNSANDVYYLPASRSGLYQALSAFTPIIAELTQNRFFLASKSIELPSLSEPLSDYFLDLSTINNKRLNKEFNEIIDLLQKDILKGEIEYDDELKKIFYKPIGIKLSLNLSEASSMVSELSPLVLYFKHILNNKYSTSKSRVIFHGGYSTSIRGRRNKGYDIIFIEEPEAHLHPEVQIKLIEIFAKISKLNLKIFVTSHSNYMFNKLNNLLIKKEVDNEKLMVYHLTMNDKGSKNNNDMVPTEDGINDENFQNATEKLYYERLDYLEDND